MLYEVITDIWFVVGLPVFLSASLGWSHAEVGGFLALWVIGYGGVQALAPKLLGRALAGGTPQGGVITSYSIHYTKLYDAGR